MVGEIADVFYEWRDAQANADGMVRIQRNGLAMGLLGNLDPKAMTEIPVGEATPYEVAGPFVHDDIALAFRLFSDNFPPFEDLLKRRGYLHVFAVIGLYSKSDAWTSSLIDLNGFLTRHLVQLAMIASSFAEESFAKAHKQRANITKAQKIAVQSLKDAAGEKRRLVREAAVHYFLSKPTAKYPDAADFLSKCNQRWGTAGSIQRLIGGTRTEALKLLTK